MLLGERARTIGEKYFSTSNTMEVNVDQCTGVGVSLHAGTITFSLNTLVIWMNRSTLVHFFQAAHDWGFFVIATDLPKYMNDVLHVTVQNNGIFSSIPHLVELIFSFFIGYLSDWLIAHQYLNATQSRKLFVFLGMSRTHHKSIEFASNNRFSIPASILAAVFFIAASYAGCDQTLVVLFFTLSVTSQALTIPGTYVNPLDLSPNYIGPLTALVNGVGSTTGKYNKDITWRVDML